MKKKKNHMYIKLEFTKERIRKKELIKEGTEEKSKGRIWM